MQHLHVDRVYNQRGTDTERQIENINIEKWKYGETENTSMDSHEQVYRQKI